MRQPRLSQDAEWAWKMKPRNHIPLPRQQGMPWGWLTFGLAAAILLIVATALIVGCTTSTSYEPTSFTWECAEAPHIRIVFDGYDNDGYGDYLLLVGSEEMRECRSLFSELTGMLKDGHWEQITEGGPLFLPPPPNWDNFKKEGTGIRINGSDAIIVYTKEPLPADDWITILQGGVN